MVELNQIYNQDCLEGLRTLPDGCVDMVLTDPPYVIGTQGGATFGKKPFYHDLNEIKDGFATEILDELCRVMKKINIYLFCSRDQIIPLTDYFVTKGCNWNLLTWHKTNPVPACGNKYITDTEYILFFREKGVQLYGNYDTKRTWYATPTNVSDKAKYGHPTCKPVSILSNLITNSTLEGGVILDPFIGSGSTAVAALKANRHFLGYEINEKYYKTAIERIKEEKSQMTLW